MCVADAYLVDTSIYVFRAWHSLPSTIIDAIGRPANAVCGFTDFVARLLDELRPQQIGFAFDVSLTRSFRNEIYPLYKANRDPAPEELKLQFRACREFLQTLGLATFSNDCYEADDLIGTLARQVRIEGNGVHILTADKDLAQLLEVNDSWWDYSRDIRLDCAGIKNKFGVRPDQIADQLAIAGDKVDNIPGVPGIGMATAARLLKRFKSLENLLQNIPAIGCMNTRGAKRLQSLVDEHQETIRLSRLLTGIQCNVELPCPVDLRCRPIFSPQLDDLFTRLNFSAERKGRWDRLLNGLQKTT